MQKEIRNKEGCRPSWIGSEVSTSKVSSRIPLGRFSLRFLKCQRARKFKAKAGQARCIVDFTAGLAEEFSAQDGCLGEHRCAAMVTLAELFSLRSSLNLAPGTCPDRGFLVAVHIIMRAVNFKICPQFHYFAHARASGGRRRSVNRRLVEDDPRWKNRMCHAFCLCSLLASSFADLIDV